ncbi:hypothetical protein Tco_0770980 [Tanacetum coccineum]|uniref:Uncharacterized protein n=1 Tax=Tanacetum coccineum TaxID=301880 RepID=A0ABQ4ZDQ9_9ASTR
MRKPFTRTPDMFKEYLAEFWYSTTALENSKVSFLIPIGCIFGEVGVNTFRNAIGAHYLAHAGEYVAPPSIDVVRQWFPIIGYGEEISAKGYGDDEVTLYPTQVFSVNNWTLKPNQPEEPPFTDHMLAICATDKPVVFKAPKPSSIVERVPQGTKPEAQAGHKKKESSSAIDSNSSQPPVSTTMDPGMHKKDQQETGSPTTLGVTSEARANPRLSSGMSAFNLNEPIYLASFIIHSESASGNDALAVSIAEADPGNSAPNTDPHVLAEHTKSVSEGLDTVLTQPLTGKGASSIARLVEEEEASRTIKLEDLSKVVGGYDGIHAIENVKTEDTSVPKLKLEKNKVKAEAALFKAQPSFPNVEELNKLLVKSLKTKLSNILSTHDFSSSILTELKNLPSKFNKLTEEVTSVQVKLKTLDALPGLLSHVTKALNKFSQVLDYASSKAGDQSVPLAG